LLLSAVASIAKLSPMAWEISAFKTIAAIMAATKIVRFQSLAILF
jgi:hypothetical protein